MDCMRRKGGLLCQTGETFSQESCNTTSLHLSAAYSAAAVLLPQHFLSRRDIIATSCVSCQIQYVE